VQHAWWITTNLNFSEWPRVFGGDEKLTAALLDRLAEAATIITTRGRSYRMRNRKGAATGTATDPPPPEKGSKAPRA